MKKKNEGCKPVIIPAHVSELTRRLIIEACDRSGAEYVIESRIFAQQ